MIVSITGATGFIGSHLADLLLQKGYTVRALIRGSSNLRWLKGKDVELVKGDIHDPSSLERLLGNADYVYHIAGVVKSIDREGYFLGNVDNTRAMLEGARKFAPGLKRFLYVSSQTAAGPSLSVDQPVKETDECRPITTYGRSKVAAEGIVRATENIPWTIVRPPAVYGPRDTEIFIYFQTIARGLNSMIGLDDKRLSLIHSSDLVRGIVLAAESERSIGQTYFISSEEFYSWPQVGEITSRLLGKKVLSLRIPHVAVFSLAAVAQVVAALQRKPATLNIEKARDLTRRYWTCDVTKAKTELGYRQEKSLEDGITETIRWYKEQGWLR